MEEYSRREFIQKSSAGVAALTLAALGLGSTSNKENQQKQPVNSELSDLIAEIDKFDISKITRWSTMPYYNWTRDDFWQPDGNNTGHYTYDRKVEIKPSFKDPDTEYPVDYKIKSHDFALKTPTFEIYIKYDNQGKATDYAVADLKNDKKYVIKTNDLEGDILLLQTAVERLSQKYIIRKKSSKAKWKSPTIRR